MSKKTEFVCDVCGFKINSWHGVTELECRRYVDTYDYTGTGKKADAIIHICPECREKANRVISNGDALVKMFAEYYCDKRMAELKSKEKTDERV